MKDIDIARKTTLNPIKHIADKLHLSEDDFELYGKHKAKLSLKLIDKTKWKNNNLILVSAMSPTPSGEGKTMVSIGLAEGLNQLGKKTCVVLREPSLGPVFGMKGGATGGGYSQVLPMEDINLHFTGDFAAVEKAHNLLSALVDNNLQNPDPTLNLNLDPRTVVWKRVMDMNDRSLRQMVIGLGGKISGVPRETGFNITAASEIMAILCLADDLKDLKERLGKIFIGFTYKGKPIYAKNLNANGAMAVLLKDVIKPNLVQTIEGNPAIIHGGPFANIAQGTNSVIATRMGLSLCDFVVTEAGFGADLGAEKFLNIKCQSAGLSPKAVVLVATVRALKYHGGVSLKELTIPNKEAVSKGIENLKKHVQNIRKYNLTPIVSINRFVSDTDEEISTVIDECKNIDVNAVVTTAWADGGKGAISLAKKIVEIVENKKNNFKALYSWNMKIEDKIETIAKEIYGAATVEYTPRAKADLLKAKKLGLEHLPVCIAKTQKSLSDNDKLRGRPENFVIAVREVEIAAGAGFLIPITGKLMRMPGLPRIPSAESIDIDNDGNISGLF